MARYLLKRILLVVPVMLTVVLLVFGLLYLIPGSALNRMPVAGNGDGLDAFFAATGLEDGFFAKYLRYCYNILFHLDFGFSARYSSALGPQLLSRWGYTLRLSGAGLLTAAAVGLPAGVCAAVGRHRWPDRVISVASTVCSSVPSYWLALVLTLLFALRLDLLPASGVSRPGGLILPVATVAVGGVAQLVPIVRAAMLETLDQPYVTALRAKGLRERLVLVRHGLRNALIPIAAALGELSVKLLCGTLVAEKFFAIPGVGYYLLTSVTQREHGAILGCAVSIALLLVVVDLATDLLCLWADPQMKKRLTAGAERRRRRHAS